MSGSPVIRALQQMEIQFGIRVLTGLLFKVSATQCRNIISLRVCLSVLKTSSAMSHLNKAIQGKTFKESSHIRMNHGGHDGSISDWQGKENMVAR